MEKYLLFFAGAILAILLIFPLVVRTRQRLGRFLVVLTLSAAAALGIYFGAKDIFGRANPFGPEGRYLVESVYLNPDSGEIYIFVTGKDGDSNFKPRLLVLSKEQFGQNNEEITKILELGKNGRRVMVKLRRGRPQEQTGSEYGPGEKSQFYVDDPLRDVLPPKQN